MNKQSPEGHFFWNIVSGEQAVYILSPSLSEGHCMRWFIMIPFCRHTYNDFNCSYSEFYRSPTRFLISLYQQESCPLLLEVCLAAQSWHHRPSEDRPQVWKPACPTLILSHSLSNQGLPMWWACFMSCNLHFRTLWDQAAFGNSVENTLGWFPPLSCLLKFPYCLILGVLVLTKTWSQMLDPGENNLR